MTKLGSGTLTVGDNAAWTGATNIEQGGLQLGSESASVVLSSTQVNIAEQGTLSGFGGVAGISTTPVFFRLALLKVQVTTPLRWAGMSVTAARWLLEFPGSRPEISW